jgi:arsenate reductase-like glutaredoxin family protein
MTTMHIRHIRASGYCARGAREWAKRHGIDYNNFLKHGIDCDLLEQTGDHFALTVCKLAREEEAKQKEANDGQG